MKRVMCRIGHYPDKGYYGDCLRAVVASMLDIEKAEDVPHFYHDGCDDETADNRLRDYLKTKNLVPCRFGLPGSMSLDEVLDQMNETNPDLYYMLCGATSEYDHIVICRNNRVVHNPAWGNGTSLEKANSVGAWGIMVFVNE